MWKLSCDFLIIMFRLIFSFTGQNFWAQRRENFNTNKLMQCTSFGWSIAMIKIKIVFFCFSFRCEEITVECFSMQAENLTWSFGVKILWSTDEIFSCLFDLQNVCRMWACVRVRTMCEPASQCESYASQRAMWELCEPWLRVMRAMAASHACQHYYWKLTVLKWVLKLNKSLSTLFEMGKGNGKVCYKPRRPNSPALISGFFRSISTPPWMGC